MDNKRPLTLKELTDIIEAKDFWDDVDDEVSEIYISPPDTAEGCISDEDSADEDEGGFLDNLSGRQLQAHAEVVFASGTRLSSERRVKDNNDDDQHSFDSEDVLPLSTMVRKGSAITNRQKFTWSKSDLVHTEPVLPETDRKEYRNMAPVDALRKFLMMRFSNF
nr:unnamed protein product [Callosobruchus chinensis]